CCPEQLFYIIPGSGGKLRLVEPINCGACGTRINRGSSPYNRAVCNDKVRQPGIAVGIGIGCRKTAGRMRNRVPVLHRESVNQVLGLISPSVTKSSRRNINSFPGIVICYNETANNFRIVFIIVIIKKKNTIRRQGRRSTEIFNDGTCQLCRSSSFLYVVTTIIESGAGI